MKLDLVAGGPSPVDAPFWQALEADVLALQRCECGTWHWPASNRCGECGRWDPPWTETPLEGVLYSWIRTHYAFPGAEGLTPPYVTVLVELPAAGNKRLIGIFEGDQSNVVTGMKLKGRIDRTDVGGRGVPSLRWSAVAAGEQA